MRSIIKNRRGQMDIISIMIISVVLSLILMLVLGVVAYFQNRQGASAQYG